VRAGVRLLASVVLLLGSAAAADTSLSQRTSTRHQDRIVQQAGQPDDGGSATSTRAPTNRYSLANGCYGLRASARGRFAVKRADGYRATSVEVRGAEHFYIKATALGSYLLYDTDRELLAVDALGRVRPAREASRAGDWRVRGSQGRGFTLENHKGHALALDRRGRLVVGREPAVFGLVPASDCRKYPEIEVDTSGPIRKGSSRNGVVTGLIDAHMHQMAFEFLGGRAHCGRPWHRYGAPYALVDCPDHQPNGAGAILENTVSYGNPVGTHDTHGWPTFKGWPHHASLTHEQSYYKWLERAWRGGERIFVNLLVENKVLCELYPLKKNSCNEMQSARLQARRMHELQNYIDAQNGGPGKGWYRIVKSPEQARRVANEGKLAVVMGMETSEPFNCGRRNGRPTCTRQEIDRQLDSFYRLGVRQLEIVNKFDNGFTGVAGDDGATGGFTNSGNFLETGSFWDYGSCSDPRYHDHDATAAHYHNDDALIANGLAKLAPAGPHPPVYPPPPNCNRLRLSSLGRYVVARVMAKGMIFDPDHMGVYARQDALGVVERHRYPGIISSHSWSTEDALPRIYALGGMVTPYAGDSKEFVAKWRRIRGMFRGPYYFGFGYGADMNGFGSQGGPRGGPNPVTYPFRSFDGRVTFARQRSGTRVYDINRDGVAHYGLYPDWLEDARRVAGPDGPTLMREMGRGAEAYLQMWARATAAERR